MIRRLLQRYFVTGLLTLIPIWLTWIVFKFVFQGLSMLSAPWIRALFNPLAQAHPGLFGWLASPTTQFVLGVLMTVSVILFTGWLSRRVIGKRLLLVFEQTLERVPLAKTIYGGTKQLLEALQTKPDGTQRVVLIDFPSPEMKTIGLVTRVLKDARTGEEVAAVYVPTTPNPTSGYLEIVPVSKLTPTDWTVDQAMAFIISGGAKSPETLRFYRENEEPIR
jgi:uncharacterized membrane protein